MSIKRIKVTNFKSFQDIEVELGKFNVFVGANASGKSNFINIFTFLKDIATHGLNDAISLQGGVEYLRNVNIGSSKPFSIEIDLNERVRIPLSFHGDTFSILIAHEISYKFSINFPKRGKKFKIGEDHIRLRGAVFEFRTSGPGSGRRLGSSEISITNQNGSLTFNTKLPDSINTEEVNSLLQLYTSQNLKTSNSILIKNNIGKAITPSIEKIFGDIAIYDFDSKLPKKAVPITGRNQLESDGRNLAIVLKNILEDSSKKRSFSNLIRDMLPFFEAANIESLADKSLMFNIRETYTNKTNLPSSLMSDGTVNITSLIIALYFEDNPITIIEEPERNLHPHLISKLTALLKESSNKKQVIVTTHNPSILKFIDIENLFLISRNKEGFSIVQKPSELEHVRVFLENEIGIEDLYIQNLLSR